MRRLFWAFAGCTYHIFVDHSCYFWCVFIMLMYASFYCCLVVTCWERTDLLALVCDVLLWVRYFPIGMLGQVWYFILLIPDICLFCTLLEISCRSLAQNFYLIQCNVIVILVLYVSTHSASIFAVEHIKSLPPFSNLHSWPSFWLFSCVRAVLVSVTMAWAAISHSKDEVYSKEISSL